MWTPFKRKPKEQYYYVVYHSEAKGIGIATCALGYKRSYKEDEVNTPIYYLMWVLRNYHKIDVTHILYSCRIYKNDHDQITKMLQETSRTFSHTERGKITKAGEDFTPLVKPNLKKVIDNEEGKKCQDLKTNKNGQK